LRDYEQRCRPIICFHPKSSSVGRALVSLTKAPSMQAFMDGLEPLSRSPQKATHSHDPVD